MRILPWSFLKKNLLVACMPAGAIVGVLHAGFYYSPDSLKAQLTRDGNERLRAYCQEKNIHLNQCGKLVVAKDHTELAAMDELVKRGKANGIPLQEITAVALHTGLTPVAPLCRVLRHGE